MKKVLFHAGSPKTATTSIQRFLLQNRERLLQYNIDYVDFGPPRVGRYTNADPFLFGELGKRQSDDVQRMIDASPCDNIIISDEELFCDPSIFRHPVFSPYKVEVLFYLRPPVDLVASWAGEFSRPYNHFHSIREGSTCSLGELVSVEDGIKRTTEFYKNKLSNFINFFEINKDIRLILRPFDKSKLKHENIISDFLNCIGVDQDQINDILKSENLHDDNKSQNRKFLDIASISIKLLSFLGLEHYYDELVVYEIDKLCLSGDVRSVINTLSDDQMFEIYNELISLYERILANKAFKFEGFSAPLLPKQYGQTRHDYVPVDMAEVRNLISRYVVLRMRAERAN